MRTLSLLVLLFECMRQETSSALTSKRVKRWSNDPICGIPKYAPRTAGRVVGGDAASPYSWPWRAMIVCFSRTNSSLCGGSIISNQWILTAAHCMQRQTYDISRECTVYVGRHYLPTKLMKLEATEQSFSIKDYVTQDRYNNEQIEAGYDIALVKLSRLIRYTKEILPICLPFDQAELTENSLCYSGGWGYTKGQKFSPSHMLKQIRMPIQTDSYCGFMSNSTKQGIMICAGKWNRLQNLCYGDSGGPLECKSGSRWYLHGVLSQVDKYCVSVASFAKVKEFQDWIESHIGKS